MTTRLLALAALLAGCAPVLRRQAPPQPTSERHGALFLRAVLEEGSADVQARAAKWARVGPNEKLEEPLLPSNYASDGAVYLLDVPPGRYAPVSLLFMRKGLKRWVRLEAGESRSAAADVGPGETVFQGDLLFTLRRSGWKSAVLFKNADTRREAAAPALAQAKERLAGTLWMDSVDRALRGLSAPSFEGAIQRPGAAVKERFSYLDKLRWGKPYAVVGGLEWKQPQDFARIALVYLSPGMKGYRPKDEQLQFFRDAGSAEDEHLVRDVLLAGRAAHRVRYTTYYYPEGTLVGSSVKVLVTEVDYAPDDRGGYLLVYRAQKKHFNRFYKAFSAFRDSVVLK